jgi:hypothetical protein
MGRVVHPSWIDHLSLRQKFALLASVAMLGIALPAGLAVWQSWRQWQGLQAELEGILPAQSLLALVKTTQEHRGLSNAVLHGAGDQVAAREQRQLKLNEQMGQAGLGLKALAAPAGHARAVAGLGR